MNRAARILCMWSISALCACCLASCEDRSAPPPDPGAPPPVEQRKPSTWHVLADHSSHAVAVPEDQPDAQLSRAIDQARRSSETARKRWQASNAEERQRWAVKWAAPTSDGGVEHVWVRPLTWSPFRIEGVLASPPQHELEASAAAPGDVIAFPIEELSDWIEFRSDAPDAEFEGGFTVKVLEERHGTPEPDATED